MTNTVLDLAAPQCVAEDFDGEIVTLNLDSCTYFSIKGSAARLWSYLVAGHAVEALVAAAGTGTPLGTAIGAFADAAKQAGLLPPASGAPATVGPATLDLSGAELPVLEAYDDMQSLLLLDPVHEVDEEERIGKMSCVFDPRSGIG